MSTMKVVTVVHPSGSTNNIVNDASGNVTIGNNLTVTGTSTFTGNIGAITSTGSATATAFIPSGSTVPTNGFYLPAANTIGWSTNTTQVAKIDSSGNFSFNSGYGSAAVAYGCRAWVNFNGTGTVAIRASGNVTSITDNGTGDYTVNFTTAMSDANYALVANSGTGNASFVANRFPTTAPTTSAARIGVFDDTGAAKDDAWISVQVVR